MRRYLTDLVLCCVLLSACADAAVPGSHDQARGRKASSRNHPHSAGSSAIGAEFCAASDSMVTMANGNVRVEYDLSQGKAVFYHTNAPRIRDFYAEVTVGGQTLTSTQFADHSCTRNGSEYVITTADGNHPTMKQHFYMVGSDYFLVAVEVQGRELTSNRMTPLKSTFEGALDVGCYTDVRALWVPWDNDKDVKYDSSTINRADTSFEYSVFFDNPTRHGIVIGSVTHDTWKTAIDFIGSQNVLTSLTVYGGAKVSVPGHGNRMHRDTVDHGSVEGDDLWSPTIFIGYFDDWRNGLEQFGAANAGVVRALATDIGVPFGWNSWGALGSSVSFSRAVAAADYIKNNLMPKSFENQGTTYINLDSYWDNFSSDELRSFVQICHDNGQKAGIYWAPFVDWAKNGLRQVEGSAWHYHDIWLKDREGNSLTLDNAIACDPTHPGTQDRINYFVDRFKSLGFDYIKIDFTAHAALEGGASNGEHYDAGVKTGIQAYHQGMQYLVDRLDGSMFISLAISPNFPYQYAHARRVSSDKYGYNFESRDELNSAAFAWWMNGRLYQYNDPDHLSTWKPWWGSNPLTDAEAKSRVIAGAITGTVFLTADDMTDVHAAARASRYLTNPSVNDVARKGKAFRPVEGNVGTSAPNTFVLDDGHGVFYVAVFNWNGSHTATIDVNLTRIGLDTCRTYTVTNLWDQSEFRTNGSFLTTLEAAGAELFRLE